MFIGNISISINCSLFHVDKIGNVKNEQNEEICSQDKSNFIWLNHFMMEAISYHNDIHNSMCAAMKWS